MELNLQAKLLRFLQTGVYSPVGSSKTFHSDVRIISATNRNPAAEVGEGRFREDLYYRLNVIPVNLPAIRERGDDILLLANHFLKDKAEENNKEFSRFSADVEQQFLNYEWPGNVRELQNIIENIVVINNGECVDTSMLPETFSQNVKFISQRIVSKSPTDTEHSKPAKTTNSISTIRPLEEVEKEAIEQAIDCCDGNVPLAAAHLGVSASTIYRKIKSWQ